MKTKIRNISMRALLLLLFIACDNPFIEEIVGPKKVSFESNGGSGVESQTVFKNQPVKRPPDPSRSGYTFDGWYSDNETFLEEWDFAAIPNGDMTLYAKWNIIEMIPITDVDITITQPETGAVLNNNASGSGNFTIGDVLWSPNDNPFLEGVEYTATVTLTANQDYAFALELTATINGNDAAIESNTASELTLSYTFPPTRTVTGMAVTTQPTNLTYIHGDALDLSGLVVTFDYNIGSPEDVAFGDFVSRSISTDPDNGTALVHLAHNGTNVTVIKGSFTDTTDPLTVNPKVITFTVDPIPAQEFNGSAITPTVTVRDGTTELTLTEDYTVAYSNNTVAGNATVSISGAGNYAGSTGSANFIITKKVDSIAVTKQPTNMTYTHGDALDLSGIEVRFTYDDGSTDANDVVFGDFGTRGLTTNPEDGDVLYRSTHNNTPVTITYNNNSNITAATNLLTVNPKVITFTVDTIPAQEYTGDYLEPAVTVKDGAITLTRNTDYTVAYSNNLIAGTANVTISGIGNYVGSTGSATFVITKKVTGITVATPPTKLTYTHGDELDLSGIEVRFTYDDGSTDANDVVFGDFESRGLTTVPANGAALSHATNNGTTTVTITYSSFTATTSVTVNQKALTIATATHSKTYDGTTDATDLTVTLDGIVSGDLVSAGAVAAVYTNANAGTTTVNITGVSLTGAAMGNYTVTPKNNVTVVGITRKNITVTPNAGQSKVYGETDPAFIYTYNPALVAGHTLFSGALGRVSGENAGTYAFEIGTLAVADGNSGNNYSLSLGGSNVFTINKADPTGVAWPTGLTATYGQTLADIPLTSHTNGGAGTFEWDTPNTSVGNAGTQSHSMTYKPTNTNYNTSTQNVTITVNKADPTVTFPTNLTAVYGQTLVNISLPGDGIIVTAGAFSWTTGNSTSVGDVGTRTHNMTFTPTVTANYNTLTQDVNITVNKANPDVTFPTNLTATYGQTLSQISPNGTSVTPGAFSWTASGTTSVGNAGTRAHNVTFAPTDTANYNTLNQDVNIEVGKAAGAVVAAPTVNGTPTLNSVTLNAITTTTTGQTVEYARSSNSTAPTNDSDWQTTLTFSYLNAGTTYYFFARAKANDNYNAGAASAGTPIATTQQQGITVTLDTNELLVQDPGFDIGNTPLILSRTGVNKTATVNITGTGTVVSWKISGVGVHAGESVTGTSSPITLNALEPIYNSLGWHTVTVTVTVNGMQYMNSFRFQIVN